ncbi:MAG TPA: hypothetical protein VID28_07040 [Methylomirabilota bacterium]|jgi:hypothetical protein
MAHAPLACIMDAIPETERGTHIALTSALFTERVQERRDVSEGYAFRFPADAFADLARFLANERRCCPFLSFKITLAPNSGPIWLRITGPMGTRALLAAELPALDASRPASAAHSS